MFPFPRNVAAAIAVDEAARNIAAAVNNQRIEANRARNIEMREAQDPFHTLDEFTFRKRFRLSKDLTLWLLERIAPLLPDEGPTSGVPKRIQVLVTLKFYASGDFQISIGDCEFFGLSQCMVSQVISNVTDAMTTLSDEYIVFPDTEDQFREISEGFQGKVRFPGVVGCIDCIHVLMRAPDGEPWHYKNYKGTYSLNIPVACDHRMRIMMHESGLNRG
ncbi:putative nuclease HARBI1 [Diachasma alloeum]|uniref:putative nuclease HARBI1 n=1 Tax=Diachasma alloeum TaxID=454923 RepID=UPI0007383871|nr:putative nuclease HARBI1 [Diachasma alloeum]